jgi:F420-dependent oxidoreductase-like protein
MRLEKRNHMLEIALMLEGQNGLTWPHWQSIVRLAEEAGFVGLYRSDHFTNANPPDKESLELWVSLTWLADNTKRIEFGPLVSPVSFRHPALTARMAAAVDDLSDGRLTLGLGAGWQEREHHLFGFDLWSMADRFDRFEEGLEVITRLLQSDAPVSFEGKYYQLREAALLPRPQRKNGPSILIGGLGPKRTLSLTARFADEWNCIFSTPQAFAVLNTKLDAALQAQGRAPASVRRSMMTGCYFGHTDASLQKKIEGRGKTFEQLRESGVIVGRPNQVKEQLQELEEVGLQRIMLQWLDLEDLDGIEALAKAVL